MKNIIVILVTFICIFNMVSFASADVEKEITFSNIPWLSDDLVTLKELMEIGYIRTDASFCNFTNDYPVYLIEDDNGFISPDRISGMDEVTFVADFTGKVKGKIAGCAIKNLRLTFAYDGFYHLIAVKVDLINGSFTDLKEKLTKVYGEGDLQANEDGIDSIIWKGSNNTGVALYTQNGGYNFQFVFGRIDATDILSNCIAAPDHDDVSGL